MNSEKIRTLIVVAITVLTALSIAISKPPPADLGYEPPIGWEYVMKLDSMSEFFLHSHNDTCYVSAKFISNAAIPFFHKLSTDGGETWADFHDLSTWKFKMNSNVLHRTIREGVPLFYEVSYDLLKTIERYEMYNNDFNENGILECPTDTNLIIYSYRLISKDANSHVDDHHQTKLQISKDAGRNWDELKLNELKSYTVHTINFDWADKGRFLYKIEDGWSYGYNSAQKPSQYFETSDYGKTSQEIKFDPTFFSPYTSREPAGTKRLLGVDGPRTIRESPRVSEYGISVSQYDDTLRNTKIYDWLYIMDPSKPKSNRDSNYRRFLFFAERYHFDVSNYHNIIIPVYEIIGDEKEDFKNIVSLYTSIDNGATWNLLNVLDPKPFFVSSNLDQGTKTIWIHVKDIEFKNWSNYSQHKGSLWKLKLPWEPTSVEGFKGDDDNISIYPNPASEYIEISVDINPTVNRRVDEGSEIKIYNTLGECVMTVETRHAVSLRRVDVSLLPKGVYYIRIGNQTQMFVKV